jgi:hypothetical protein
MTCIPWISLPGQLTTMASRLQIELLLLLLLLLLPLLPAERIG